MLVTRFWGVLLLVKRTPATETTYFLRIYGDRKNMDFWPFGGPPGQDFT